MLGLRPPGPRPSRSVLRELLLSMLAFGVVVGFIFPPFARTALGAADSLSVRFYLTCIAAGALVGAANFLIFKVVVSREISHVVEGMRRINKTVATAEVTGNGCGDECKIEVTSDDLIGDVAVSFNSMAEAIARRVSVESTTRGLLADLSTTVELEGVSDRILASLCRICSAKAGVLYANTGNRLELLSCSGVDRSDDLPESIDATQGLAERALSTGEIVHVSPSKDGFEWVRMSSPLGAFLPESIALVPLMAEQRPAGLAVLASPESDMSGASRQLADAIRHQAAPYLGNAVLHRKLEDLAAIDELTHVLNRRFGMRRLSEEFSRATRHGTPLSLVMLDIDHFKVFNDTFGHDAGDAVLVAVASIIEKSLRAGDLVCRYGGEEFLVVAPGMGLSDAGGAAERLRRTVETTPIEWRDQSLHVTVSLGAAAWPVAHVSVPEELVTCADEALYHSKNSGRDRVSLHQGDSVIPLSVLQPEARG